MRKVILMCGMLGMFTYAFAATAFFTGQQRQVQTVTHRVVWECEYNYNGSKFTRLFETSCPASVEVQ